MENNIEIPEEDRHRRKSLQKEIEKAAAEHNKAVEEKEKIKDFTKNTLFADLQKEVQHREEVTNQTEHNKKIFSNEVLAQLPKHDN